MFFMVCALAAVLSASQPPALPTQDYIERTRYFPGVCAGPISYKTFRQGGCQSRVSTVCLNSSAFVQLTWADDACSAGFPPFGLPAAGPVRTLNVGCAFDGADNTGYFEACVAGPLALPLELPGYAANHVGDSYDASPCTFSPSKSLDITAFADGACVMNGIYVCNKSQNRLEVSVFDGKNCSGTSHKIIYPLNNCTAWRVHDFYWACAGSEPSQAPSPSTATNFGSTVGIVVAVVAAAAGIAAILSFESTRNFLRSRVGGVLLQQRRANQDDNPALPLMNVKQSRLGFKH